MLRPSVVSLRSAAVGAGCPLDVRRPAPASFFRPGTESAERDGQSVPAAYLNEDAVAALPGSPFLRHNLNDTALWIHWMNQAARMRYKCHVICDK